MNDPDILKVVIIILLWIGSLAGMWVLARWFQRRRGDGMSKEAIMDLGKRTISNHAGDAIAKVSAEYESALAIAKKKYEELNLLKRGLGGGG